MVLCVYLRTAGWGSHASAGGLHQGSLVGWQQVILHGFNQVVFTRAAVLNQRLLLHPLKQPISERPSQ